MRPDEQNDWVNVFGRRPGETRRVTSRLRLSAMSLCVLYIASSISRSKVRRMHLPNTKLLLLKICFPSRKKKRKEKKSLQVNLHFFLLPSQNCPLE